MSSSISSKSTTFVLPVCTDPITHLFELRMRAKQVKRLQLSTDMIENMCTNVWHRQCYLCQKLFSKSRPKHNGRLFGRGPNLWVAKGDKNAWWHHHATNTGGNNQVFPLKVICYLLRKPWFLLVFLRKSQLTRQQCSFSFYFSLWWSVWSAAVITHFEAIFCVGNNAFKLLITHWIFWDNHAFCGGLFCGK